jgi:hypothetical protein
MHVVDAGAAGSISVARLYLQDKWYLGLVVLLHSCVYG